MHLLGIPPRPVWRIVLSLAFGSAVAAATSCSRAVAFERVFELDASESVFAYSRISPDGRSLAYASYARELPKRMPYSQVQQIVELKSRTSLSLGLGVDGYWSPDGTKLIFMSLDSGGISIFNRADGIVARRVAPDSVGDYYSWGTRDGKSLLLTAQGNFFYLTDRDGPLTVMRVPACDGIGTGERPLLSKDGQRITAFANRRLIVRNLTDCDNIIDTGIEGAKADFSWDGRYIAFHVLKPSSTGYDLKIVDLQERTARTIAFPSASATFPSWTRDGRISFRYDGLDYRGFVMARNVLALKPLPLKALLPRSTTALAWEDIFPDTPRPRPRLALVTIWATWSAHSPIALGGAQSVYDWSQRGDSVAKIYLATDPASRAQDISSMLQKYGTGVPSIRLSPERFALTDARNQIPTTLLFRDGLLVDRKLGAHEAAALRTWIDLYR